MQPRKVLTEIKGLSDAKVEKMLEAAQKLCSRFSFTSAKELEVRRQQQIVHISTGSAALDEILGGGIETGALTEIYGEYRCGKTQLCCTLCVTSQINDKIPGKAIYIDTEGSFRPKRIRDIADRFQLDGDQILANIVYGRAFNYEQQISLLENAAALMAEEQFKILIMDSLTSNFRTDFSGRGELAERQQRLNGMLAKMRKVAEEFNCAIMYTNQVMSDPSGGAMFVSDPKKPIGGHVVAHASTYRLYIRKGKAEQRILKLVQAPGLPEAEASFAIGSTGIEDYKD